MKFVDFFGSKDLKKIYSSEVIRYFGLLMVEIFIPIYFLQLGFSFREVVFFFIIKSAWHIMLAFPASRFGAKYGFKYSILISVPFQTAFFALLYNLASGGYFIYLLALIVETGSVFYWTARHSLFAKYTDENQRGREIGVSSILVSLSSIPSPLIGGLILAFFGIKSLLIVVLFILLLSVIPLILIRENWKEKKLRSKRSIELGFSNIPIFLIHGMDNILVSFVWPVYSFFTILTKYILLGFVSFLSKLISVIGTYVIGFFSDKKPRKVFRIGAILSMGVWIARMFAKLPLHVYATDSAYGFSEQMVAIPFNSKSYSFANKSEIVPFIAFREVAIHVGKIIALLLILLINNLKMSLILGIFISFLYFLVWFRRR